MRHFLGVVVTVTIPIFLTDGVSWKYDEPAKVCRGCDERISTFPDDSLKPIRGDEGEHPGDKKVKPIDIDIGELERELQRVNREIDEILKPRKQVKHGLRLDEPWVEPIRRDCARCHHGIRANP